MNTTDHRTRPTPGGAEPEAGKSPAGPATLGELIDWLIDERDGIKNLRDISRKTSIPYQTLYSWWKGSRNMRRPPAEPILRTFAADLDVAEAVVFRAAGRAFPQPGELGDDQLQVLHFYGELPPADKEHSLAMLRDLADRARGQGATRK